MRCVATAVRDFVASERHSVMYVACGVAVEATWENQCVGVTDMDADLVRRAVG